MKVKSSCSDSGRLQPVDCWFGVDDKCNSKPDNTNSAGGGLLTMSGSTPWDVVVDTSVSSMTSYYSYCYYCEHTDDDKEVKE